MHDENCICVSCLIQRTPSPSWEQKLQRMADDERDQVRQLGERIGYGRMIQFCEELYPEAHTVLERKELKLLVSELTLQLDNAREQLDDLQEVEP